MKHKHTQVLAPDAVREMELVGDADQDTLRVPEADNDVEREMEMVLVAEMDDASFTSPASVLSTWVQGRVGYGRQGSHKARVQVCVGGGGVGKAVVSNKDCN